MSELGDVRFIVNWFEDVNAIARGMGLDIELPDVGNEDDAYWETVNTKTWRDALKGKVAMTPEDIDRWDPDWVLLVRLEQGVEVWFDIEEGVRFRCVAKSIPYLTDYIRKLAREHDLVLSPVWPGTVWASQTGADGMDFWAEDLAPIMVPAGYVWKRTHWELVP
jgi:hypothetical protein